MPARRRHDRSSRATATLAGLLAALAIVGPGCDRAKSRKDSADGDQPAAKPITRTADAGDALLAVTYDRAELSLGGRVRVTIKATAAPDVIVQLADYADRLEERRFEYRAKRLESRESVLDAEGRLTWTDAYEVEFFASGDYELAGAAATFTRIGGEDVGDAGADSIEPVQLETDPVSVTVTAPAAGALTDEELAKLELPAPKELQRDPIDWRKYWWAPIAAIAALVALVLLIRYWNKRMRRVPPPIFLAPADWARQQLQALLSEKLLEQGHTQEFYYRLSDVVRQYIERGFELKAPEQTTQEFLSSLQRSPVLGPEDRGALAGFLEACDVVKYARHEPTAADHDEAIEAARRFLDRTAEQTRFFARRRYDSLVNRDRAA